MIRGVAYSVVVPIFNEQESITPFFNTLEPVMNSLRKNYEIIFANDGSKDESRNVLKKIKDSSKNVIIVDLKQNYGESAALKAGFDVSSGDMVITIDGDSQYDAKDIYKLIQKINSNPKYQAVFGLRNKRSDSWSKRISSKLANYLVRLFTGLTTHDIGCTFGIYKREAIKSLIFFDGIHRFIPVILAKKGYQITEVKVHHYHRHFGSSHYGILDRIPQTLLCFILIYANRFEQWAKIQNKVIIKEVIR